MKKIFLAIIALVFAFSAEAQVSVRRTSKKTAEQKTEKKAEAPARVVMSDEPVVQNAPVSRQSTVAKKKTVTTRRETPNQVDDQSLRRQLFEQNQQVETSGNRWQHIVYRELDINVDANAALYYPQEPVDGMDNFFRVMFDALLKGKLNAYEYLDGREIFEPKYLVNMQDVMDRHDITPTEIPSYQVMSYYIKEQWEFDRHTSQYGPRVLAVCPILHAIGDFGSTVRYPLFWVKYDDLRPFINTQLVMTAEMNIAPRYTMDDFFTLNLYEGEIYKVQNPRGLTLMQQYPDPEQLAAKRAELEAQLKNFGKGIWVEGPSSDLSLERERSGIEKKNRRTKASVRR